MNTDKVFGKSAYFYDKGTDPEELIKLVSYGIQQDDNGYLFLDNAGKCVYANRKAYSMFYVMEDLDFLYETFDAWRRGLGIEADATTWCRIYASTGKERLYRVRFRRVHDENGKIIGSVYVVQNVSDSLEGEYGEHYRLTHDDLTQLYNKEGFIAAVRNLLMNSEEEKSYVLVYSNIRDFKLINQLFGIDKGNDILVNIADAISQRVREEDVYGRINGDQFALCMPKERFDENEFKSAVKDVTTRLTSASYSVHMQLGVYEIRDKDMDISLMCDRAYMACKSITKDGSCEIAWYSDDMLINALLEKEILSSFDFAIINRQFGIYLQPQVYADGKLFGAEALARWIHPENGIIQPGVFITVLEKADLIYKLDRYIWELAAKQLVLWKGTDMEDISISVNVSPKDLYYIDIREEFNNLVRKYGINPRNFNIEITETAVTTDVAKCAQLILGLQKDGFIVEIDDFGSGYSSLNMLKDINANILKIDMGFLRKTENQKRAQVILNYTIDMAHELGMGVITEGVETSTQLEFLKELGCEMFQGYYFDMPMPVDEFEKRFEEKYKHI